MLSCSQVRNSCLLGLSLIWWPEAQTLSTDKKLPVQHLDFTDTHTEVLRGWTGLLSVPGRETSQACLQLVLCPPILPVWTSWVKSIYWGLLSIKTDFPSSEGKTKVELFASDWAGLIGKRDLTGHRSTKVSLVSASTYLAHLGEKWGPLLQKGSYGSPHSMQASVCSRLCDQLIVALIKSGLAFQGWAMHTQIIHQSSQMALVKPLILLEFRHKFKQLHYNKITSSGFS